MKIGDIEITEDPLLKQRMYAQHLHNHVTTDTYGMMFPDCKACEFRETLKRIHDRLSCDFCFSMQVELENNET